MDSRIDGFTVHNFLLVTGHLRKDLLPSKRDLSWRAFAENIVTIFVSSGQARRKHGHYNVLQRLSYLFVIFVLFPLVIWTGLAMSPAFVSAIPRP